MIKDKTNILVSGGDGFIGSHLVKRLVELGFQVIVVDNNVTSIPRNMEYENVIHLKQSVEEINTEDIPKVNGIFHLASIASPLVYKNDFNNVYRPNVIGTMKLIELAKRDHARIIYTSTSEVYGMLSGDYVNEDEGIKESSMARIHLLTNRSIYASAKRMGEELIYHYKKNNGDGINIRFFNVYGNGMDVINTGYGRVIPNFINGILKEDKITIFGDGSQIRSFLWIEDAIDGLIKVLNHRGPLPDALNLGNTESLTILELANLLFDALNKRCLIEYKEIDKDDPLWRKPNTNLAKSVFNWLPKIELRVGLNELLKGYLND